MKKPNLLFFGIDSLRRDHMSLHGYDRLTTPHMDKYLKDGVVFENCFSPHIPTTPGYANMLTGFDCFGTNVVALRHKGDIAPGVETLAEVLGKNGYNTTNIGFTGNCSGRGFARNLTFEGWGGWQFGRSTKAENLNAVAIPELERLAKEDKPFFLFMRHMDPHSPYLPPEPFHRMFYQGNEFDPENKSLEPVYNFKPFADYLRSWFPPECTDKDYIIAQYDAAVAYMDACIALVLEKLKALNLEDDTLVVFVSDHGETLYDHDCYFDHHGLYDPTLVVPFALRFKGKLPAKRIDRYIQLKDVTPTILDILGIATDVNYDGHSMLPVINGQDDAVEKEPEMYITECTWERKHGWRTPEWKLIVALEPDLHFKPAVELYNLIKDPEEYNNVADQEPEVVKMLTERMMNYIAKREKEVGRENPMYNNLDWHGKGLGRGFISSQEAYDSMYIGDSSAAKRLQAMKAIEEQEKLK